MERETHNDSIVGIFVIVVSAVSLWELGFFTRVSPLTGGIGPKTAPTLLLLLLFGMGLTLLATSIVKQIRKKREIRRVTPGESSQEKASSRLLIFIRSVLILSLMIYVWIVPSVGFFLTTLLFVAIWVAIVGALEGQTRWRQLLVVSIVVSLVATEALVVIFGRLLQVPLP